MYSGGGTRAVTLSPDAKLSVSAQTPVNCYRGGGFDQFQVEFIAILGFSSLCRQLCAACAIGRKLRIFSTIERLLPTDSCAEGERTGT